MGAEGGQDALATRGVVGRTDPTTVIDEVEVEYVTVAGAHQGLQKGLGFLRGPLPVEKAEATTDPEHVAIHGKGGAPQSKKEDPGGSLGADGLEPPQVRADLVVRQIPQEAEIEMALLSPDLLQQGFDVNRFDVCQATRTQRPTPGP